MKKNNYYPEYEEVKGKNMFYPLMDKVLSAG